jgi:4-hydroxy-tetrahydrodipicolinate reductase
MSETGVAVPVAVMGLGEIGRRVARAALTVPGLELVSAVDASAAIAGRPLGEWLGAAAPDVRVLARAEEAFAAVQRSLTTHAPDGDVRGVLLHATGSRLEAVVGELEAAVRAGLHVVSSCEELACPWVRHERLAERLDRLAERHGVTVVGVGVNPGFVLDRLVATLAQATGKVQRVDGLRVVDASTRREALQRKIGAGLGEAAFHEAVEAGKVGHVGLMESAALAAMGVGRVCDEVDEEILPILATSELRVPWGIVRPGEVAGVHQVARAFEGGAEVVRLELRMALGAADPRDEITIHGEPPLTLRIPGGTPGDDATAWTMVHAAEALGHGAEPGLVTVLDLPSGR